MKTITVSAPGKLMLLGEHSVVYGHPCLVTAVDQRLKVTINILDEMSFVLDAPDVDIKNYKKSLDDIGKGDIPKGVKFVEIAVKNFKDKYSLSDGIHIVTSTDFSSTFGFGSSSASTVATIKALSELFEISLTHKEIFDLSYETVLDVQGTGSGFDIAAAVYGGILYFVTGGKTIEPVNAEILPLVVVYSGEKADTVTIIKQVAKMHHENKEQVEKIFGEIDVLVEKAKKALEEHDWKTLGEAMNQNQDYLRKLGVSTKNLDDMIKSALESGAYGAKLSGAGGGDCMIALSDSEGNEVENVIERVGGEIIKTQTHAEGVRIEV